MKAKALTRFTLLAAFAAFSLGPVATSAQTKKHAAVGSKTTSGARKDEVEKIVREYLLENPAVIRDALQVLQQREEIQRSAATAANLKLLKSEIYSDADSPAAGNAQGDVTVVVFFDYFCGYCKKTLPALETLLANDNAVRVVYKEFPILGPQSLIAARAALAAGRQGKFVQFHLTMIGAQGAGEEVLKAASERLGLDYARLDRDMRDPMIAAAIDRNIKLATSLNVNGTPAYLIGDRFIPGAVDSESLAQLVKDERAKLAKREVDKSGAATKGAN